MASPTLPASPLLFSSSHQICNRARVNVGATGTGKQAWWAPLFRSTFSGERSGSAAERESVDGYGEETKDGGPFSPMRFSALTPEKARVLRQKMRSTEIWHDAMYHSAIASRLASPDQH